MLGTRAPFRLALRLRRESGIPRDLPWRQPFFRICYFSLQTYQGIESVCLALESQCPPTLPVRV